MSNNQLTTLPDEIFELKELVWLNVSNNKLTVLSSHIRHLNKLWVLLLRDNQLTILPDNIGELKGLENAACGWTSCNLEEMRKDVKLKPRPQNGICIHLYLYIHLYVLFKISDEHPHLFQYGSPIRRNQWCKQRQFEFRLTKKQ